MIARPATGERTGGRWLILALLYTAFFTVVTDSTSVFAALPSIRNDLSFAGGHWVVKILAIASSGFLLLGGRLAAGLEETLFAVGSPLGVAIVAAVSYDGTQPLSDQGSTVVDEGARFAVAFSVVALLAVIGCFTAIMVLKRRKSTVPAGR